MDETSDVISTEQLVIYATFFKKNLFPIISLAQYP